MDCGLRLPRTLCPGWGKARDTLLLVAFALLGCMAAAAARGEDVKVEHTGLESWARFESVGRDLGQAVVVLLIHDTLDHAGSEMIASLQVALKQAGVPSLAPTLSRGINARRGPFDCKLEHDHRAADTVDEIVTWIGWLKGRGVSRVALLGHAYGSLAVLDAAATDKDQLIRAVILLSPPVEPWPDQVAAYKEASGGDLEALVATASKLIEAGEEDGVLEAPVFLRCRNARVSVTTLLEHYGHEVGQRIVAGTAKLAIPALVVGTGGAENTHLESRFSGPGKPANAELVALATPPAHGKADGAGAAGPIKMFTERLGAGATPRPRRRRSTAILHRRGRRFLPPLPNASGQSRLRSAAATPA